MSGQLDEISMKIGEISGYMHDHRHEVANVSMKLDGLRIELGARIKALEELQQQRVGVAKLLDWLVKSPLVGWLIAAGAGLYLFVKGGKP